MNYKIFLILSVLGCRRKSLMQFLGSFAGGSDEWHLHLRESLAGKVLLQLFSRFIHQFVFLGPFEAIAARRQN